MISHRISLETKAVMEEARALAKMNGFRIDIESIFYDIHAAIVRDFS
jgi:hypothetical protein